jgi:septum formation topological specificity factor MinE
MKRSLLVIAIITLLVSCNQKNTFKVSGKIQNAAGKTLYFQHNGILETSTLDSVKLDAKGEFSFKSSSPKYPDFYRLKLDNNAITFAIDSCEKIVINAKAEKFSTDYDISGSETSVQIQKLRKSVLNIQRKVNTISPKMTTEVQKAIIAVIEKDIEIHKEIARKLILQNPRSIVAYFAIYQQVNNVYLFSPFDKADKPYCAAVATSFNVFMPEYVRSKNLYNRVMEAIKEERSAKKAQDWSQILANQSKNGGYINIELPDKNNVIQKLSALVGKTVLINFTVYKMEQNADYIFALRELYDKYHNRGFEIYQVSLDNDEALWQQAIYNIPWTCVRDLNGANTKYVDLYNISEVPTSYLLNKSGTIVGRYRGFAELQKAIEKNL